jgi:hypothetical protein
MRDSLFGDFHSAHLIVLPDEAMLVTTLYNVHLIWFDGKEGNCSRVSCLARFSIEVGKKYRVWSSNHNERTPTEPQSKPSNRG